MLDPWNMVIGPVLDWTSMEMGSVLNSWCMVISPVLDLKTTRCIDMGSVLDSAKSYMTLGFYDINVP